MNFRSYMYVLLAAVLWGTTGTAQSFIEGAAHPLTIGALRLGIGGFALLLVAVAAKKIVFHEVPWRAVFLSAAAMALFQPFFFSAVQLTGVAVGTVVAIGSAPVFSGMIEWIVLKRRPDRVWVFATASAIIGCMLLFINGESSTIRLSGVFLALGAGAAFAGYAMVSKSALRKMEAVPAVAVIFSISACFLFPFLLFLDVSYIGNPVNLGVIAYLGIGATSISYLLFSTGLKKIPSSSAVTLSLAEPLTAAILGVFIVREVLSNTAWIGVALLLGGILILTFGKRKAAASVS
ncbi:EamA family transporter [Planococcus sp. NCCP-2050]|uniref:EamA family transporter n=1 Tax=Planococcus sp. NCCP-2050 TaxID=2944679 RepID=UPI00203A4F6C|nr:EamA family transporter [Planococcus sp. NCCP-2050]GKW45547.1 putative transporter YwfM [Planococcus sp. NCCP-2050]